MEGNLLPVAVTVVIDGVLLSIVNIAIDDPRLHDGVGLQEIFAYDDEVQVMTLLSNADSTAIFTFRKEDLILHKTLIHI